jgi:NDP-sugar pyrophosphorylase family protein
VLDDQIVILCGGMGTRVQSIMGNQPKILMQISNKSFLEIQLQHYYEKGFRNFFYIVGYGGNQVIEKLLYIQKKYSDVDIKYYSEGEKRLGTGGSILSCEHMINDKFLLTYGDNFLRLNFKKFSKEFSLSTKNFMTIYKNSNLIEPSNINCDKNQNKILAYNKENKDDNFKYIDYGFFGVIKKDFIEAAPSNACFDLKEFIKLTIKENKIIPFFTKKRFYDIGNIIAVREFTNFYQNNSV